MGDAAKKQKAVSDPPAASRSVEGAPALRRRPADLPEPDHKHAKRSATKRRLAKATGDR